MEMKKESQQKLAKFAPILGIVHNPFKPTWVQKSLRTKVPNALAFPLLYGSKIGSSDTRIKNDQHQWRQNFSGDSAKHFDHKRNGEILEELNV